MKTNVFNFLLTFTLLIFLSFGTLKAEITRTGTPVIGAQVLIEQGQTKADIEQLFKTLSECHMTICRIRMFESYMKDKNGNWDFTLFDYAFHAADNYHIEILATLFPYTEFSDIGGFKFPFTYEHQQSIAEYIKQTVTHFSKFKSLYGWVILNEPGSGTAPFDKPFTADKFKEWKSNYTPVASLTDQRPSIPFLEELFLLDYNTWYLNWIAGQIKVIDPNRHIHVNNHRVFDNYAEYDFPKWRPFLSSLGGSAHASWHFGMFDRKNYHYAMAANSEIIRSGAGELPWIMTEIQAGNNIWSGSTPMCPTKEEIEQWSWIILGTGSKGMIYWTLNPRATGIESGEWAMLDLLNRPTDRLKKLAEISKIVQSRTDLFNNSQVAESGVALIYTRESMWAERKSETKGQEFAGRMPDAGMKSLIGFYETLSQMGIQSNIQSMDEYHFKENNTGRIIILANQIVIPSLYKDSLEHFVSTGGTLLVEGLTGFFDENMRTQTNKYAQLSSLLGGKLEEIKFVSPDFLTTVEKDLQIPSHLFQSTIFPNPQTKVLAKNVGGDAIFIMNNFGKGRALWIPTCIGIAAHLTDNYIPLSKFIETYLIPYLPKNTIRLKEFSAGVAMKTLLTPKGYVVVLINKNDSPEKVDVILPDAESVKILNKPTDSFVKGTTEFTLQPEETLVVEYQKTN